MDARSVRLANLGAAHGVEPLRSWLRWISASTIVCLLLLSLFLAARRIFDPLARPLDETTLLIAAYLFAAILLTARLTWRLSADQRENLWLRRLTMLSASASGLLFATALSIANPVTLQLVLFWSLIVAVEIAWWISNLSRRESSRRRPRANGFDGCRTANSSRPSGSPFAPLVNNGAKATSAATIAIDEEYADAWPAELSQQISRFDDGNGEEVVAGQLRSRFSAGERTQSLHVAFCPPLDIAPALSVEQLSGPRADIKAAQVETFGIRLDVRLAAVHRNAVEVVVQFHARAMAGQANEASTHKDVDPADRKQVA